MARVESVIKDTTLGRLVCSARENRESISIVTRARGKFPDRSISIPLELFCKRAEFDDKEYPCHLNTWGVDKGMPTVIVPGGESP
jgi:hypothetical protein